MTDPPPWRARLDAALASAGGRLAARYAQLATVRPDGRPANRTVVVRALLDPGARPLITLDARSAKVDDLAALPWAELCWWFPATREQFRLLGRATLIGPTGPRDLIEVRARTWSALPEAARQPFAWPAPGVPRAAPSAFLEAMTPDEPPLWFALMVLDPELVEHLDLRPTPHDRTRYRRIDVGWLIDELNP